MKDRTDFHCDDLLGADYGLLYRAGIRYLFFDIDNTLVPPQTESPTERVRRIGVQAREAGLTLGILTNSRNIQRGEAFQKALGAKWLITEAFKPAPGALRAVIEAKKLDPRAVCLAGDQLITDRLCAKWNKIFFVLVKPVVDYDQAATRLNRLLERPFRRSWERRGLLGLKI